MVGTKARWYAPTVPARADPPVRGNPIYPGLIDGDKKKRGREKRRERQPQRKPGGAPAYKPYDYPTRPRRVPEAPARPAPSVPDTFRGPGINLRRMYSLISLAEDVDRFIYEMPGVPPSLPANWRWCRGPVTVRLPYINKGYFPISGSCAQPVPLVGQAPGTGVGVPLGMYPAANERYYWRDYSTQIGPFGAVLGVIQRVGPWIASQPEPKPQSVDLAPAYGGAIDPNIMRAMPGSLVEPVGDPVGVSPALEPGYASAPVAFANPDLAYEPDYHWIYTNKGLVDLVGGAGSAPAVPGNGPGTPGHPTLPPGVEPAGRRPPNIREKQRKVLTRSEVAARALFKALDVASEYAEIVDAVYDALPDSVKDRWDRPSRPGDSFGQYGLGGADWKLQALYYNWHLLDPVQAVKNILRNELQDQTIGRIQAGLPKTRGRLFLKVNANSRNCSMSGLPLSLGFSR